MRNMRRSMPALLVLTFTAVALAGLAWSEGRDGASPASAATLLLIDAATEAATDSPADAYMPGLFK